MNKKVLDLSLITLLSLIVITLVFLITGENELFGSSIDYVTQHSVFPDYIRYLFYETGDLFPDFMPHLGSGQNIYNISYYGLYNPIILFSYLLPFVEMIDYLMIISVISVIISSALLYKYFIKHNYSRLISFIGAVLFITASPILFHSHRHLMFVNYMPFLILGLYAVDNYIDKRKSGLLIFCLTMIIYTSYYYSVGAFVSLFVYLVYRYFNKNKKVNIKKNINDMFKYCIPFLLSILIGSLLLFPTFDVILFGRSGGNTNVDLLSLIIPSNGLVYNGLIYSAYSMGLSIISLVALVYGVFKFKLNEKILSIFILFISFIPLFSFALNGFLYIDYKSLIPFIPIVILITVMFLKDIFKNKYIKIMVSVLIISTSLISCYYVNTLDKLIQKDEYIENKESILKINEYLKNYDDSYYKVSYLVENEKNVNVSDGMYRSTIYSSTQNIEYKNFYYNVLENDNMIRNEFFISSSNNIISQMYLSEKYIITDDILNNNYKYIDTIDGYNIYENINVLPIGYATNNYINSSEYENLGFQDKMINLLGNTITNTNSSVDIKRLEKVSYNFSESDIEITEEELGYIINASKDSTLNINVDSENLVILTFEVEAREKDFVISANGIENKLTDKTWKYYNNNEIFTYVIDSSEGINLDFSKGSYTINNFEIYEIPDEYLENDVTPFNLDMEKTKGDFIYGNIETTGDSMFVLNIPYDENFIIKVNGKEVNYEKVNETFIGFVLEKGNHYIEIEYKNNIKNISLYITGSTIIIIVVFNIIKRRKK